MADEKNNVEVEDEASQLKRTAIRALMFDKSLTSAERTKQIQLIMSGKIKPATEPAASASAATETSTPSANDDNMGGADKPQSTQPPPAAAASSSDTAMSFEEKLRAKMNEINVRSSSSKPSTMERRNSGESEDNIVELKAKLNEISMRSSSSKSKTVEPINSDEAEVPIGGGEDSTVELGTIGEDGDDSTLVLGTIGGGEDSTVELGTIDGGEDDTVELGTIGDEDDLSSLESKSSFTRRNWANRFRAAALEAKIAEKMRKSSAGAQDNTEELKEDGEDSDGEYTFESASCFSLVLNNEEPSSSQGVGNGPSLPIQEEHTDFDEEAYVKASVSAISPVDNSSDDIEVLRHSFSPTLSMREGDEPNVPNLGGLAVARAVAPDDEPDYVFQGKNNRLPR